MRDSVPSKARYLHDALQHCYLARLRHLIMSHMAFMGMDPYVDENKFTFCLTPASFLEELHRQQLAELEDWHRGNCTLSEEADDA